MMNLIRITLMMLATALSTAQAVDTSTMILACQQPVDTGPCKAAHERYYFNDEKGLCEMFYYGGCGGTLNRFDSLEDCNVLCKPGVCSPEMCMIDCSLSGFKTDSNGCKICECEPVKSYPCPVFTCPRECPPGFTVEATDANGCTECECVPEGSQCPAIRDCNTCCSNDNMKLRCCQQRCACEAPEASTCSPIMCMMACPAGFEKDENGCDVCRCAKEDPCKLLDCSLEETCLKEKSNGVETAQCVPGRRWCSTVSCSMFCPDGFATDTYGCSTCVCRQAPAVSCPEQPEACPTSCDFGHSFDENGCKSCDCLPNTCRGFSCVAGQVCAAHVHDRCPFCPVTPRCIAERNVRRVQISLKYSHNSVQPVNLNMFQQNVKQSMIGLLKANKESIKGMEAQSDNERTVFVKFNLLSSADENLVHSYNSLVYLVTNDATGSASITQHDVTFTPEPFSLASVYYRTALESDDDDDDDDERMRNETIIIAVAVGVGVFLVVITVCIFVVACRRRSKKPAPIYKQVSRSGRV